MSDSPDSELPIRDPDMPDDALGLGLPETQKPSSSNKDDSGSISDDNPAYRVLARKYRPQNFKELIGQDAMVQTLGNAIKRGRLAHAFLMTGVRGVGKTSTARLIAKALNCVGEDGQGGATIDPCGKCEPCIAIAEGRHIDVIEMDAASHTGVDDVRDIIEAVRYASVSARYKIYIIDEVHMLSKNAFNALLKTLEEPPPHVKFLFATTEVNKVPITVLSRCQRFDLKRISIQELAGHFGNIVNLENVNAEEEALALIARSAEGSVRDGLSILDQAIAHADWHSDDNQEGDVLVTAQQVRDMLGLSDRSAIRTLLSALLKGDVAEVMAIARTQYQLGIEPYAILAGLLREVHMITLAKLNILSDPAMSAEAKSMMAEWGDILSFPQLHRLWQLLLKGHEEIQSAAMPSEACDMALLRILHASSMPDPSELLKSIQDGGANTSNNSPSAAADNGQISANIQSGPNATADDNVTANENVTADDTGHGHNIAAEHGDIANDAKSSAIENRSDIAPQQTPDVQQNPETQQLPEAQQQSETANLSSANDVSPHQPYSNGDMPATFDDLIEQVGNADISLDGELRDNMRLVKYDPPLLEYQLSGPSSPGFADKLRMRLKDTTGEIWTLREVSDGDAMPSQLEQAKIDQQNRENAIRETPLVKAAIAAFPDADFDKNSEQYKRSIGA